MNTNDLYKFLINSEILVQDDGKYSFNIQSFINKLNLSGNLDLKKMLEQLGKSSKIHNGAYFSQFFAYTKKFNKIGDNILLEKRQLKSFLKELMKEINKFKIGNKTLSTIIKGNLHNSSVPKHQNLLQRKLSILEKSSASSAINKDKHRNRLLNNIGNVAGISGIIGGLALATTLIPGIGQIFWAGTVPYLLNGALYSVLAGTGLKVIDATVMKRLFKTRKFVPTNSVINNAYDIQYRYNKSVDNALTDEEANKLRNVNLTNINALLKRYLKLSRKIRKKGFFSGLIRKSRVKKMAKIADCIQNVYYGDKGYEELLNPENGLISKKRANKLNNLLTRYNDALTDEVKKHMQYKERGVVKEDKLTPEPTPEPTPELVTPEPTPKPLPKRVQVKGNKLDGTIGAAYEGYDKNGEETIIKGGNFVDENILRFRKGDINPSPAPKPTPELTPRPENSEKLGMPGAEWYDKITKQNRRWAEDQPNKVKSPEQVPETVPDPTPKKTPYTEKTQEQDPITTNTSKEQTSLTGVQTGDTTVITGDTTAKTGDTTVIINNNKVEGSKEKTDNSVGTENNKLEAEKIKSGSSGIVKQPIGRKLEVEDDAQYKNLLKILNQFKVATLFGRKQGQESKPEQDQDNEMLVAESAYNKRKTGATNLLKELIKLKQNYVESQKEQTYTQANGLIKKYVDYLKCLRSKIKLRLKTNLDGFKFDDSKGFSDNIGYVLDSLENDFKNVTYGLQL